MEKVQMQLKISTEVMDGLKADAEKQGISPNILARMILHKHFQADAETKSYTFTTRNWRELEAYVKVRNLGSVEGYAPVALDMSMSWSRLSARQRAEFDRLLGN